MLGASFPVGELRLLYNEYIGRFALRYLEIINEYIDLSDVGDDDSLVTELSKLTPKQTDELCFDLWANLPTPEATSAPDYRFVANSALSGMPFPCIGLDCRARNVSEAAYFSAIYANELVLFNPFRRLILGVKRRPTASNLDYIRELAFHVATIIMLEPLIEKSICTFEEPQSHDICADCFRKIVSALVTGDAANTYLEKDMYYYLLDYFASSVEMSLEKTSGRQLNFSLSGPEDVLGHEHMHYLLAKKVVDRPIKLGEKLSKEEILKYHVADDFAHYTTNDIAKGHAISNQYGIDNILSSPGHLDILKRYFGDAKFSNSSNVDYPFIASADLSELVKFREKEWHHLHDFRKMVKDGLASGEDVDEQLASESAKIQGLMSRNARTLNRSLLKDAGVSAMGMTVTVATAGVSGLIAMAVGALSGGHLASGVIPRLIDRFSEPEEVRDQKSYYAWKIKRSFLS